MLVYVDDIIIMGSSSNLIDNFVAMSGNQFFLKDLGPLYYFLGVEVHRMASHICFPNVNI